MDALNEARALLQCGEYARAKDAFLVAMYNDRYNREGMLGLSEAFIGLEDYQSARLVLAQALAHHPDSSEAYSMFGGVLLELDELNGAHAAFERALHIDPSLRKPWAGLGVVYERVADVAAADHAWREAFRDGGPAVSSYRGAGSPVRVLLLRSAVGGNVPLGSVFDDHIFQVITLFVESFHEAMSLPEHDVTFNIVGNADIRSRALDKADIVMRATTAPIVNHPTRIRHTGRLDISERLRGISGIVTPRMHIRRKGERVNDRGLGRPLLVRALGFHGGEQFVRVDDPTQLSDAEALLPGDEVLAIEFVDTRSNDGLFRKYRMLSIDGRLYPSHLAVSSDWKVHYFSAMHDDTTTREERAFLDHPASAIGSDALQALRNAAEILALDYAGFDFALDTNGRVVVFEANATMRVGTDATAIEAVRSMIAARARQRV